MRGEIGVDGLKIANPEGMSEPQFLNVPKVRVKFSLGDLLSEPRTVQLIEVQDAFVSVVVPKEGDANVKRIFVTEPENEGGEGETEEPAEKGPLPSLRFSEILASNLEILYVDESVENEPEKIRVVEGNARVRDLAIDPKGEGPDSDTRITFRLADSPYPNEFYARAWTPPISGNAVDFWSGAHFSGVDLSLAEAYVTPMAQKVIGSDVIDVTLDVAQHEDLLLGSVTVLPLNKQGLTLKFSKKGDEFKVDKSSLLLQAFALPFGRILNLGQVIPTSVEDIVGEAGEVVDWAANTVTGTAGELIGATGEVATAAGEAVGGMAKAATKGDVVGAAKEVGGLAGKVLGAGAGAAGGILGGLTGRKKAEEPAEAEAGAEINGEEAAQPAEEGEVAQDQPKDIAEINARLNTLHKDTVLAILQKRAELAEKNDDSETKKLVEAEIADWSGESGE
jgi:hypothetical protein